MSIKKFYKNHMIKIHKEVSEDKTICTAILLDGKGNEILEYQMTWNENCWINHKFIPKADIDEISEVLISNYRNKSNAN